MKFTDVVSMTQFIRRAAKRKGFNANLTRLGYGKMDGKFPHDGPSGTKRAHTNEFPPIQVNRRPYGSDHFRSLKATRERLDYDIPGPLYIHRWLKPSSVHLDPFSRHWRPRDYIEVDPNLFLKRHKYPKYELQMNPYLRFPIYHRLPLHYRLMMEEPVVTYDNIVNNKGSKRPQIDGEWVKSKYWTRDYRRGRPYEGINKHIKYIQMDEFHDKKPLLPKVIPARDYQEDITTVPVPVNREHIPYEFPMGVNDKRFYHPLKGGRSENIPGRMGASTEENYARNSLEELWGGEGVIRGHTYRSEMKEYPQHKHEFNVTWWPERYFNYEMKSLILAEKIRTTVTQSTLDQILVCGGFDEYILATSPAKLMSDFGCRLKTEMLYLLNRPEQALENIYTSLKAEEMEGIIDPDMIYERLEEYRMPDHSIKWINMPIYEAMKLQLAIELDKPEPSLKETLTRDATHPDAKVEIEEKEIEVDLAEFLVRLERGQKLKINSDNVGYNDILKTEEIRLSEIERQLNKDRFGAVYELKELEDEYGETLARIMVNCLHPIVSLYARKFPVLENSKHTKYSQYSKPTRLEF